MLHQHVKSTPAKSIGLALLCLTLFSSACLAGRDSYEIYLNGRQVVKQYVGESSPALLNIQLSKGNIDDKLIIRYTHCTIKGAAKGRMITVKDEHGKVLKQWDFANPAGSDISMVIPVKDLLEIKKNHPDARLNLYYASSQELPEGLMLASLNNENRTATKH